MLKPVIKIYPPNSQDGPGILAVAQKISQFSHEDIDCIKELWNESLKSETDPDRYHFLTANLDDKVVGFACYGHRPLTIGTYDIYWIGIQPELQHQGIGRLLIAAVEEQIKSRGGYLVVLETSTQKIFSNTRTAYQALGYQCMAEIPDFYKLGDGLVIYAKRIA